MHAYPLAMLSLAAGLVLFSAPANAGPVLVTTCGTAVKGRAVLASDLDCSSHPGHALILDGRLDLGGFTLTGNSSSPDEHSAVDCHGKCQVTIKGPGTIVGGGSAVTGLKVKLDDVVIRDAAGWGVTGAVVRVKRSQVTNCGASLAVGPAGAGGILGGKLSISDSRVDANGSCGVFAQTRAALLRSDVTGNGFVDLRSYGRPGVKNSTCGTSRRANLAENWGVCSAD